ncbi:MAG TPA: ABC transporter ATP-binding protein [Pyrinomonadaceae bacterium]|nr:ABC transporter ATP-binding protein [Pyrinomonadaceae bacterium]
MSNGIQFLAGWMMAGGFLRRFRRLWRKAALANLFGGIGSGLQLIIPVGTIKIINEAIPTRDYYHLAVISSVIALAAIGAVVFSFLESHFAFLFRERANIKLEVDIFEHIQSQPYLFFKQNESGYLMSRLFNDANTTMDVCTSVTTFGRILVGLLGGLVLLPFFHLKLGLLIIAVLPVYIGVLWWFNRRTKQAFITVSEKTALTSREMYESMTGIYETKAYGAQKYRARRYAQATIDRARVLIKARVLMAAGERTTQIFTLLVSVMVITYGGMAVIEGQISVGTLIGINAVAAYLLFPVSNVVQQILRSQQALAAIERTEEWMALPCEERLGETSSLPRSLGRIQYENVSFSYEDRPPVLSDVSFHLSPGEVMLLTGPSGVGKTTLVNLLPRFLEPLSGTIYLDGKPVKSLPLGYLRKQIAFVSQDVFLFSDSITSNIRMGNSSVSDEDIYEAARLANALKFINAMPDKFDTQVGERGARLSGGQRQRIAIARAIVRDAPILVLDEATSAVDPETEAAVHEALCSLMKNKTTIIIAHHSTAFIEYVNRAFVLDTGELRSVPLSTFMLDSRRATVGLQV